MQEPQHRALHNHKIYYIASCLGKMNEKLELYNYDSKCQGIREMCPLPLSQTKYSIGTPSCHCVAIWQQKNFWSGPKVLVMTHLLKLKQPRGLSYHHGIKISYTYQWQSCCQQGYSKWCVKSPRLLLQREEMCQQPCVQLKLMEKWRGWGATLRRIRRQQLQTYWLMNTRVCNMYAFWLRALRTFV